MKSYLVQSQKHPHVRKGEDHRHHGGAPGHADKRVLHLRPLGIEVGMAMLASPRRCGRTNLETKVWKIVRRNEALWRLSSSHQCYYWCYRNSQYCCTYVSSYLPLSTALAQPCVKLASAVKPRIACQGVRAGVLCDAIFYSKDTVEQTGLAQHCAQPFQQLVGLEFWVRIYLPNFLESSRD